MAFTCFGILPAEIRIIIWKFAAKQPRNLDVWTILDHEQSSLRMVNGSEEENTQLGKHFTNTVPSILHTNREARSLGFEFFTLILGTDCRQGTYCNFELDRLCAMAIKSSEDGEAGGNEFVELTPEMWGERIVFKDAKQKIRDGWRSREFLTRMDETDWRGLGPEDEGFPDDVDKEEVPSFELMALVISRDSEVKNAYEVEVHEVVDFEV